MLETLLTSLLGRFWSKNENADLSALGYKTTEFVAFNWSSSSRSRIAPFNGWVYAGLRSTKANEFLNVAFQSLVVQEVRSVAATQFLTVFVPVRAGESVTIDISVENPTDLTIGFFRNVGS